MGFILSKFWRKKSTFEVLEQLELEITNITQFKANTVVWQKKVVGHLVTYSIVIYLLLALLVYFKLFPATRTTQEQFMLLFPFLIFPFLIWGLRKLLTWWYHRKVKRDEKKLDSLKEKKRKILNEVMDKETYKVAKQILDRFGPSYSIGKPFGLANQGIQAPLAARSSLADTSQLRRRVTSSLSTSLPVSVTTTSRVSTSINTATRTTTPTMTTTATKPLPLPQGGPTAVQTAPPPPLTARPPPTGAGDSSRSVPGPPLPRPVLPRERGYFDQFVEYLVGDGPTNRYALICRQCQSHNGMALREEFEYVSYRCCYCYYWNPARKQRPVAPKLPDQSQISAVDTSGSESEESLPASVTPSRRGSLDKGDNKLTENTGDVMEKDVNEEKDLILSNIDKSEKNYKDTIDNEREHSGALLETEIYEEKDLIVSNIDKINEDSNDPIHNETNEYSDLTKEESNYGIEEKNNGTGEKESELYLDEITNSEKPSGDTES